MTAILGICSVTHILRKLKQEHGLIFRCCCCRNQNALLEEGKNVVCMMQPTAVGARAAHLRSQALRSCGTAGTRCRLVVSSTDIPLRVLIHAWYWYYFNNITTRYQVFNSMNLTHLICTTAVCCGTGAVIRGY